MDVLVYHPNSDYDTNPTLASLRALLAPFYTVQATNTTVLASHPWSKSCALLVLLSSDGRDEQISVAPKVLHAVQSFVDNGGRILALGFGASTSRTRLSSNTLQLWDPTTTTAISLLRSPSGKTPTAGQIVVDGSNAVAHAYRASALLPAVGSTIAHWAARDDSEGSGGIAAIDISIGRGSVHVWNLALGSMTPVAVQNVLRVALGSARLLKPESSPKPLQQTNLPPVPASPLPQFLLSSPSKPYILEAVLQSIGISASIGPELIELKDTIDTFRFHFLSQTSAVQLIDQARQATTSSLEGPRDVVVLQQGILPPREATPRFNAENFFVELNRSSDTTTSGGSWKIGEALLYGEAVTSTQTLLERNPKLLSSLPAPVVSLASFQLAGRGRGSNIWLSPEGCLQFSVQLRVTLSTLPAARLVFVQYLFGLAVVSACKDERALGGDHGARIRLKWPNDIYLELGGVAKKIGGILVNTSFTGGTVDLIIGCGLNVATPPPMASLSSLLPQEHKIDIETVLALILSKFESIWKTFLRGSGSWAPFEGAYLDAWMHSDQLVTVTTVSPLQQVRILGITPDYGLLRTVPVTGGGGFIDLQPDGNSFDLMEGLIKAKK